MTPIEEKKKKRFQFLNLVYEQTEGNKFQSVNMLELGKELDWDEDTVMLVVQYLEGENLVAHHTMGGNIVMTHYGVVEIEHALAKPEEDTTYFPPVINIMSGDFRGSIVNVSSSLENLSQNIGGFSDVDKDVREELQQLLEDLKQAIDKLPEENIEDAEVIAWAAENLIEEKTAKTPNKIKVKITKEGLKEAAKNILTVMPHILPIVEKIILIVDKIKQ